ncbi:preprotein translocase subunit YajC [Leucobacter sp. G161]|uniref:preprotein translocase subunit YajC n=1 Tax=Leucobacter sp. G161 TaxID=663704 RepID=UPI00073C3524|nr:preprotein translocase subunit YajC [Leucobacter sp. G161]KUF07060.1 preprotein translocase [Leucobacter sp. G161]
MDPMTLIMLGLVAVLIFFMFRNSKKRQAQMAEMQNNMQPGAEVMLQSGIFGTILSVDEEENRVTVMSGTSTLVVHRNAVGQVVTPVDAPVEESEASVLAPDDDPEFGERFTAADDAPATGDTSADLDGTPAAEKSEDKNSDKE